MHGFKAVFFGTALALAMLTQPATTGLAATTSEASDYVLGPNDMVRVTYYGLEDKVTETRISAGGSIILPFLGTVNAAGMTSSEFARSLKHQLEGGGFYSKANVGVDITAYVSNVVTVTGKIGGAGVFPLDRRMTVATAIARAGGVGSTGSDHVLLSHRDGTPPVTITVSDIAVPDAGANTVLRAGDIITVAAAETAFIYGEVARPGAFPLTQGMTVRQLLAMAGGPTLAGSQNKISTVRDGRTIKRVKLDDVVQNKDTLYVHEKIF